MGDCADCPLPCFRMFDYERVSLRLTLGWWTDGRAPEVASPNPFAWLLILHFFLVNSYGNSPCFLMNPHFPSEFSISPGWILHFLSGRFFGPGPRHGMGRDWHWRSGLEYLSILAASIHVSVRLNDQYVYTRQLLLPSNGSHLDPKCQTVTYKINHA